MKFMTARQLADMKFPELVVDDGRLIRLVIREHHFYSIEAYRINTPAKAIGWLYHLSGKGWFTNDHMRQLIDALNKRQVPIDFHS